MKTRVAALALVLSVGAVVPPAVARSGAPVGDTSEHDRIMNQIYQGNQQHNNTLNTVQQNIYRDQHRRQ